MKKIELVPRVGIQIEGIGQVNLGAGSAEVQSVSQGGRVRRCHASAGLSYRRLFSFHARKVCQRGAI